MATADFRTGRHVVYKLHVHIVLVPKYRREVMTQRVTACLRDAFSDVCGRYGATLDAFESDGGPCSPPRLLSTEGGAVQARNVAQDDLLYEGES